MSSPTSALSLQAARGEWVEARSPLPDGQHPDVFVQADINSAEGVDLLINNVGRSNGTALSMPICSPLVVTRCILRVFVTSSMTGKDIVAKQACMTIRIVPPSRFIRNAVDERRARLPQPDDAGRGDARAVEAVVCIVILAAFVFMYAALVFIVLAV